MELKTTSRKPHCCCPSVLRVGLSRCILLASCSRLTCCGGWTSLYKASKWIQAKTYV